MPTTRGPHPAVPEPPDELREELREFLVQSAVTLTLEGRRSIIHGAAPPEPEQEPEPPHAGRSATAKDPAARQRRGRVLVYVAILLLVGSALVRTGRAVAAAPRVPGVLLGGWTTEAPQFAGRMMRFDSLSVTFRAGPGTPWETYPVTRRHVEVRAGTQYIDLDYAAPEGAFTLSLVLAADGHLSFANRDDVTWTRTAPAP